MRTLARILAGLALVAVVLVVGAFAFLATLDLNRYRGVIVDQVRQATGRTLEIRGDLTPKLGWSPTLAAAGVAFPNADWGARKPMVDIDLLEIQLQLLPLVESWGKRFVVDRVVLQGARILLETSRDGVGNWSFEAMAKEEKAPPPPPPAAADSAPVQVEVHAIELEDVSLTFQAAGSAPLALAFDDFTFQDAGEPELRRVAGSGRYNRLAFSVSGTLGSIARFVRGPFPVDLALTLGDRGTVRLAGEMKKPSELKDYRLAARVEARDLASLARALDESGLASPTLPPVGPLAVSATVADKGNDALALSGVKATIAGSDFAGDLTIDYASRTSIVGSLASARIDVPALRGAGGAKPEAARRETGRVFPDTPIPLDGLGAVDLKLALTAGAIVLSDRMELRDVAADAALAGGSLVVSIARLTLAGGAASGLVRLDRGGELAVKLSARGVDLGALLKESGAGSQLSGGRTDADLDVHASGHSVHEWMAGLAGTSFLHVGSGTIRDEDLDRLGFADLTSLLDKSLGRQDDVQLRCLVSRTAIAGGVVEHRTMVVDTSRVSLVGSGRTNLATEALDMRADTHAKVTSLLAAMPPILIRGTLADPKFAPDVAGAAADVAGAVVRAPGTVLGMAGNVAGGLLGVATGESPLVAFARKGGDLCAAALAGGDVPGAAAPAAGSAPSKPDSKPSSGGGFRLPKFFRR